MKFKTQKQTTIINEIILIFMAIFTTLAIILLYNIPDKVLLVLICLILIGIYAYIHYTVYAIKNMEYIITDNGITINYGIKQKIINFNEIINVELREKIAWSRIAGSEWPGNYTGYFKEFKKNNLINAFATSNKNVVYIITSKGDFAITPDNHNQFISTIESYLKPRNVKTTNEIQSTTLMKSTTGRVVLFVNLAFLVTLIIFIQYLIMNTTGPIPLHYNIAGEVTRYGSPYELYFLMIGPLIVLPLFYYITNKLMIYGIKTAPKYMVFPLIFNLIMALIIIRILTY